MPKDTVSKMDHMGKMDDLMGDMNMMMNKMKSVPVSGDFDIDFANMMIEHHQGAIVMSEKELSAGKDEEMKSMAGKIIASQKEEIKKLQDFVTSYKPSGMKHGEGTLMKTMSEMEGRMKTTQMTGDMDKDFATMMISHHETAVSMAKLERTNGMSDKLKQMAQHTITGQSKEIVDFKSWLASKK
jgi:uncharacterized protein (DUF305 family)